LTTLTGDLDLDATIFLPNDLLLLTRATALTSALSVLAGFMVTDFLGEEDFF